MEHLDEHEHAFVDENGIVVGIAVFDESAHDSEWIDTFAIEHGHTQVVCCCTYGKPFIGDTWDEKNKKWIETGQRFIATEMQTVNEPQKEIDAPKGK